MTSPAFAEKADAMEEPAVKDQAEEAAVETQPNRQAAAFAGYRFVTPVDNTAAAAPYQRQKSGVMGGFSAGSVGSDMKLTVDANFLNADDYHSELIFDYGGFYRLN